MRAFYVLFGILSIFSFIMFADKQDPLELSESKAGPTEYFFIEGELYNNNTKQSFHLDVNQIRELKQDPTIKCGNIYFVNNFHHGSYYGVTQFWQFSRRYRVREFSVYPRDDCSFTFDVFENKANPGYPLNYKIWFRVVS
jgi:hypothetical protein